MQEWFGEGPEVFLPNPRSAFRVQSGGARRGRARLRVEAGWSLGRPPTLIDTGRPTQGVPSDPRHVAAKDLADDLIGVAARHQADGEQGPVGPGETRGRFGGGDEGVVGPERLPAIASGAAPGTLRASDADAWEL